MGVALLAGPANVIMELARPGVGYGVMESRVESGRADRHPIKRARTTFTYLAVARRGTEAAEEGLPARGRQVPCPGLLDPGQPGRVQRLGQGSPALGGGLHLQGRCRRLSHLHRRNGRRDCRSPLLGGSTLATTLQVPEEMWPANRKAFDRYWQESLEQVQIDDAVREYLYPIAVSRIRGVRLPGRIQRANERLNLLITTGFLPQKFRDEMHFEWNAEKQRRFDRLMRVIRFVNNLAPRFIRAVPLQCAAARISIGAFAPAARWSETCENQRVLSRTCELTTTPGTSPRASARPPCSSRPPARWRRRKPIRSR